MPILSNTFKLSQLIALNKNRVYSTHVLNELRSHLVDKVCILHVDDIGPDIPICSIRPENCPYDTYEWLIRNQIGFGIDISPSEEQVLFV